MEHSKNFEKVKRGGGGGGGGKQRVYNAVSNPTSGPWITEAEYQEITGEAYE